MNKYRIREYELVVIQIHIEIFICLHKYTVKKRIARKNGHHRQSTRRTDDVDDDFVVAIDESSQSNHFALAEYAMC